VTELAGASPCKSSVENVPLRASKPPLNFHDAVFYYPPDDDDDDDRQTTLRGPAHAVSVPAASPVYCASDDQLPLKEALSMQGTDDMPLIAAGSRRRPSMLRRMKAFFGRSSSSSTGGGPGGHRSNDEMARAAGRQYSAADATTGMMSGSGGVWNDLDDAAPPMGLGGVAGADGMAGALARGGDNTSSPPSTTCFLDGGESKPQHDVAQVGQGCNKVFKLLFYSCHVFLRFLTFFLELFCI